MKKYLIAGAACLAFVTSAGNAVSMNVQAGKNYTDTSLGFGNPQAGLSFNGNWARSDHDGQSAGVGAKFALPVGPFSFNVGGKAIYLDPEDGKKGVAVAPGLGVAWNALPALNIYGEAYGAPSGLTSGSKSYSEAKVGARYTVFAPLSVDAGYRYIDIKGDSDHKDNKMADGWYVGAGLSF